MEVKASLNNLRINPRKVRLVANLIRGLDFEQAKNQLNFMIKRSSSPISKLLDSAAANAENNFNLIRSNLYIKEITVNEGRKLKRFKAKGFGRAMPIQKKTSHINVVFDERVPGLKQEVRSKKEEQKSEEAMDHNHEHKEEPKFKKEIKTESRQKQSDLFGGLKKRMFRRKSI